MVKPLWKHRTAALVVVAVAALVLMETPAVIAGRPDREAKVAAQRGDPNRIAQVSVEWARQWSAKNLDALMALYVDDAVFLPSTGSRVTGQAAIRDLFSQALAAQSPELRVRSIVTEQSGDLAYDSGEYEERVTLNGTTRSSRGSYLVVLRREGKDSWRIVEHMWTDAVKTDP